MDATLLLSPLLNPAESARQALNIENVSQLPVEFYEKTWQGAQPSEVESLVPSLNSDLGNGGDRSAIGFNAPSVDLHDGRQVSAYIEISPMIADVMQQLHVAYHIY